MKLVIVMVEEHGYRMPYNKVLAMIKMLKKEHKGKNMILAVGKGPLVEMRKDTFVSAKDLLNATQGWNKKGYKVYSTRTVL